MRSSFAVYKMKKQNIFMIGWEYPPHNSGGLGVACQGLTESLAQIADITFALPYTFTQPVAHMQLLSCVDPKWSAATGKKVTTPPFLTYSSEGVVSYLAADKSISLEKLRGLSTTELSTRVEEYAAVVAQHADRVKKEADVIHAHDWMSFPAAQKLKDKTGKPFVAHVHSTEYDRAGLAMGNGYIAHTEYEGMVQADEVIAVSHYTKQLLVHKYGIDAAKISVVHNGITPLAATPVLTPTFAKKRPVVVFMGRLTLHKGVQYFLQLASVVLQRVPDALFIVAGSGDMYHELLFTTANRHLSASVLFSGFVRDQQQKKLLDRADVFVMPSISEPFGLVALEAAQRHTPVIMSKNAGVSEVLPGGIAVDFWDLQKMADTVVELVINKESAAVVTTNQLENLKSVTWGNAAGKVSQVYKKLFTGR